ncbi:MAG: DNA polymerase III subunit delta' [Rhizobiaceae bacterium]
MTTEYPGIRAWDNIEGIPDPLENRCLINHDVVLDRLCEIFSSGKMHHAWLISGPRGIGKATLAARFAGHVLRNPDPLNAPSTYEMPNSDDGVESRVSQGAHPNLLLMRRPWNERDKRWRSDLTVDEIRRTVPFFGTSSAEDGWRVAIVDTADDLNKSSANALLKILEEPPVRTLFLILANSPRNSLSTIRSRCQKISLQPLEQNAVVEALRGFAEYSNTDEKELQQAAALAGGSVRRAILILKENGVEIFGKICELADRSSAPDWTAIHKLAGELSPAKQNDRYRLFLDLTDDYFFQRIRPDQNSNAIQQQTGIVGSISELAGWADVWEKTRRSAKQADDYNLDRKQVILNLFTAIHEMA